MSALASTLQAFFTERLLRQRQASGHTIAAYRDTLKMLLAFAAKRLHTEPAKLAIGALDAKLVAAFLEHLEHDRGNGVRTRNARLAAIRSLYRFMALRHPEHAATIARVLEIPTKRFEKGLVTYLSEAELEALLAAPDRSTVTGRRDYALFALAAQTGLRASELTGLVCADVHLGHGAHVSCLGKGRRQRTTPLTKEVAAMLRSYLTERNGAEDQPLFASSSGAALSRDALERRLAKYAAGASTICPSIRNKKVTLHVFRHTAAMRLLKAGVDTSIIALWLGHERIETTQVYLQADLAIKERALARTKPPRAKAGRYRPPDRLLAFLEAL